MPKITKDERENLEEKLKYIGLDMDNIPNFFKEYTPLEYRPLKSYAEKGYKVYRYLPISKIQILLTPENRLNTIQEKYSLAAPFYTYLIPSTEEDIMRHTTFLRMLKQTSIEEIEAIQEQQTDLNKQIPFKVKFDNNYIWQVYYSDTTDTYFMLVPTEDLDYAMLFYLIKKQIECYRNKTEEMIYVPISHESYSMQYLKKSEITDLEKYIWLFTKQWPLIYEVYDKENCMSIQIVGETTCYEQITSYYKVVLANKQEAIKFYKLAKALFILQTELPHEYAFDVKISQEGGLEFVYQNAVVTYEVLASMLNKEYSQTRKRIHALENRQEELTQKLEELKKKEIQKTNEYLQKEKQIATFLECKKSFLGKVKYFFKAKKLKKEEPIVEIQESIIQEEKQEIQISKFPFQEKEYYTIEDIIKIKTYEQEIKGQAKNKQMDVEALENKVQNMETKIKNASLYIEEIDRHEKSIFEFWRFANKDENLRLEEGPKEPSISSTHLEKVYEYQEDKEEIGKLIDKEQRKLFSKEQTDAIFLLSQLPEVFNQIENIGVIQKSLEQIKQEAENERMLFQTEQFDIFGGISEDGTKIKTLGNQKHRENEKDKLKLLEITKYTTTEEYTKKLKQYLQELKSSLEQAKSPIAIPVYQGFKEETELIKFQIFDLQPQLALQEGNLEEDIYLYRINIKKGESTIFFTNSIYFDNYNKTLPMGMDVSSKCLLDMKQYKLKQKGKQMIRVNQEINEFEVKTKTIYVYEYEREGE